MSMPQQGPPDPHTQGPVSGGPQSTYDPQAAPPPYQQTPPPTYGPPGPAGPGGPGGTAGAAKPPALMLGGIGSGVIALMFLIQSVMHFLNLEVDSGSGFAASSALYGIFPLLMALGAGAGAVLSLMGTDFGRVFAAAVGGAAMWNAAGWWRELLMVVFDIFGPEHMPWVSAIAGILGGFVGIGVVIVAATPALSTYFAEKGKKPAAGAPPMGAAPSGPQPGGPGMAPPPGQQQPGQVYGQPPTGQQPGQPYGGQQQPGQPYGGQPPAGQTYGGQQQPGATYGEQPPADPGTPPQGGPGAPPPPGQQY